MACFFAIKSPTETTTYLTFNLLSPLLQMSQYSACSGNQLNFQPASGPDIVNGAAEITLTQNSNGVDRYTVHGWVDNYIAANYPDWPSQFHHIMYVLPQNVNFNGAAAYAYIGNYKSVYWNTYASRLTVLMHETGHNLRMYHSGEDTLPYADHTCSMGKYSILCVLLLDECFSFFIPVVILHPFLLIVDDVAFLLTNTNEPSFF